jgi:transposase
MTKPKKRGPRHYTVEFKQEAVALMQRQRAAGRPMAAIARDLGVSAQLLRYWEGGRGAAAAPESLPMDVEPLQLEVKRLRRELERVEEERDFLKKAAAFFAKESP